ncbi:MAG: 50S ribosomal protein L15 [Deltaproteobacteria bacterium]|nr:50S ribosomal protein L15 [Deltaproteobacteria bacterium]
MNLHSLKAPKGSNKRRKRVGRGPGSGLGKTAGRGYKGQKSRVGNMNNSGFEGGQMPLQRRLPKFGFHHDGKVYNVFNVAVLDSRFNDGDTVDLDSLKAARMVRKIEDGVKILGNGEISKKLTVRVQKISAAAKSKIEAAGGTVELVDLPRKAPKSAAAE